MGSMLGSTASRSTRLRSASAEHGVRCGLAPNSRKVFAHAARCASAQSGAPAVTASQACVRALVATSGRVIGVALTQMLMARNPGAISAICGSRTGTTNDMYFSRRQGEQNRCAFLNGEPYQIQ
ncbi:hypothetical protein D3C77_639150 [compost metagenome]